MDRLISSIIFSILCIGVLCLLQFAYFDTINLSPIIFLLVLFADILMIIKLLKSILFDDE